MEPIRPPPSSFIRWLCEQSLSFRVCSSRWPYRDRTVGDEPLRETFEVEALSDGRCSYDGPMMNGMTANLGLVACLKIASVRIAVSSSKAQMLDRNLYRVAGIEPESMEILVNKSSVHFRADFQSISHAVLVAKAPGPMTADPADLPWTRLASGIRTRSMGIPFNGDLARQLPPELI
jgi:microcystin degradation protein MlrC